jgi:hypothetical protein
MRQFASSYTFRIDILPSLNTCYFAGAEPIAGLCQIVSVPALAAA